MTNALECPHRTVPLFCMRCGELLPPKDVTWLNLNSRTRTFTDKPIRDPKEDQGAFPFDADCARSQLISDGLFGAAEVK